MINIGILLDVCGIVYSETQLLKLETLVNNLIKNLLEKNSSNIDHSTSFDEPVKDEFFDENILEIKDDIFNEPEEFDFKHHALENHPMSNFLFGKSTKSNYLMEPAMIKKEPCGVEIKDNSDLKLIEVKSESFNTTRNLNDNNIKMSDNFETFDGIKAEENSETIFSENLGIKKEYSEELNDLNESNYVPRGNKLQKCKFCKKNFTELPRHIAIAHHACILCDKTFTTNQNLNNHVASVHEKLKPHRCDLCNASFASKSHLMIRHRYSRTCVSQKKKNFQELG